MGSFTNTNVVFFFVPYLFGDGATRTHFVDQGRHETDHRETTVGALGSLSDQIMANKRART